MLVSFWKKTHIVLTPPSQALLLTRWNDYHCLQLITADLLLSTGKFIHSGNNYEDTRECSIISSLIQEAGESICSAIPVILETMPIQETDQPNDGMEVPIGGFLAFWPLCCALKSPKISQSQQDWIRRTLWSVGLKAFFPHASALVRMHFWSFTLHDLTFLGEFKSRKYQVDGCGRRVTSNTSCPFSRDAGSFWEHGVLTGIWLLGSHQWGSEIRRRARCGKLSRAYTYLTPKLPAMLRGYYSSGLGGSLRICHAQYCGLGTAGRTGSPVLQTLRSDVLRIIRKRIIRRKLTSGTIGGIRDKYEFKTFTDGIGHHKPFFGISYYLATT